jgi:uncharacterized protein YjbI with pentapeptide repeats
MTHEQLNDILTQHLLWLSGDGGTRADLTYADLRRADLTDADLRRADLTDADLRRAHLTDADLRCADLTDADLRGADLRRAHLTGADLRGADLRGVIYDGDMPVINNIHQVVYEAASRPNALNMLTWHTCETTHCRAGWVTTLAGDAGKALEAEVGPHLAAFLIYRASDPSMVDAPNFHATDSDALADMKRLAEV